MPILTHSKQLLLTTIIQLLSLLNTNAQGALCFWLSAETAEEGRQYLFRRTYAGGFDIADARVTVAANGHFRLFVNGRAVFTSCFSGDGDACTLDVGAYMRNDSNVIAVWYAPETAMSGTYSGGAKPMVALSLCGETVTGKPFFCATDSTWLCAPSNVLATPDGENVDATEYMPDWNAVGVMTLMKWKPAAATVPFWTDASLSGHGRRFSDYETEIVKPASFDVLDEGNAVSYNFSKAFYGTFRLTVRNAKAGERIAANGSEYICRGVLDEQFVGRFVNKGIRKVVVTGDNGFLKSHVVKVEGIAVSAAECRFVGW